MPPTPLQQQKVEQLARQFGCWPDDVTYRVSDTMLDVTIGVAKDRPKHFAVLPNGRVLTTREVRLSDG